MGLTLTFEDFRRCLRNPWTVGVGFLAQYLIKPLLGLAIATVTLILQKKKINFIYIYNVLSWTSMEFCWFYVTKVLWWIQYILLRCFLNLGVYFCIVGKILVMVQSLIIVCATGLLEAWNKGSLLIMCFISLHFLLRSTFIAG